MYKLIDGISVLICTNNGTKKLRQTLTHLANQKINKNIYWEVIFIDNGSTDDSKEVASRLWKELKCPIPFNVFEERHLGKDIALDLGLSKCSYRYAIICDDDNWLSNTYLETAFDIMKANPSIGILGGKSVAVFESDPPHWFATYQGYFAVGEQNIVNGEIQYYWPEQRFLWGAGSVINMEAYMLLKFNGFSRILTARKYPKLSRSEDVEFCYAIWLAGFKVWYNGHLVLHHYISKERLKWTYLMKVSKLSISSFHYLRPYKIFIFAGNK